MACRSLLVSIAVAQGTKAGETYLSHVDHVATTAFIPPSGCGWVYHIRMKGNDANHELKLAATPHLQRFRPLGSAFLSGCRSTAHQ